MKKLLKQKGDQFRVPSKIGDLWGWRLIPSDLSEREKSKIFKHSYEVGMNAFAQKHSSEMEKDVWNHLFNEDNLFIVEKEDDDNALAFLTSRIINFNGKKVLYISGVCVDPKYQGYGISRNLINETYKMGFCNIIALRTQNPIMKECFDKSIGGYSYPNNSMSPPEEIEKIGIFIADTLKAKEYHAQTFIVKGAYGKCLYGIEPLSFNEAYNEQFMTLDKSVGDSMLCIKMLT